MLFPFLLLFYAWLLYPALIVFAARRRSPPETDVPSTFPRPGPVPPTQPPVLPSFAVLLAAHDEEEVIAGRLRNLAETARSASCRGVWLGLDGCSDATAERAETAVRAIAQARRAGDPETELQVLSFPRRRGKAAVLKDLVSRTDAAILVLTDANTMFDPDAVPRLLAPLVDPSVGAVVGRLVLTPAPPRHAPPPASPETTYWDIEARLKMAESTFDSCLGANGAIYALRRDAFWYDLPDNTIVDDFVLGMKVREAGLRVRYEATAIAREVLPAQAAEWKRRVRIGAGAFQSLVLCRRCLHPRYGIFALFFWSHKVLRWFTPHLLLLGALTAWAGRGLPGWQGLLARRALAAAVLGLGAAAIGRFAPRAGRVFRLADHFLSMQAALFVGFLRFCRGRLKGTWERTPRTGRHG